MKRWSKFSFDVISRWMQADGFGLSASMSFYTLFSFAPMVVFALMIAGHFLGEESARSAAVDWLDGFVAKSEAEGLIDMVQPGTFEESGWVMAIVSGVTLFWAATLIFVRLRIGVNRLLGIKSKDVKTAVKHSLVGRVVAFSFTIAAGLIIAGGVLLTAAAPKIVELLLPAASAWTGLVINVINASVLFGGVAAIMRYLAVRPPNWRAIAIGTTFVLAAFEIGRVLVNLYLGRSEIASAYGAASTLVVFLLWIYYSSQMLLFGVTLAGVIDKPGDDGEIEDPDADDA